MRIEAWACDRCGRLVPVGLGPDPDEPPMDWLAVAVQHVGYLDHEEYLYCSAQCASIGLRPEPKAKPKAKAPAEAVHVCPDCKRKFTRTQALGVHRLKAHGVAGAGRRRS